MSRRWAALASVGLVATVLVGSASGQATSGTHSCLWTLQSNPDTGNVAYPDTAATYWGLQILLPPGSALLLHGQFPHARYMSYNIYDPQLQPIGALADAAIKADPGSTNPFVAGARRDAPKRSYTMWVAAATAPAHPAANTIYAGSVALVNLLYRVYVPDRSRDLSGDAGLASLSLRLLTGSVVPLPEACRARPYLAAPANSTYASVNGPPGVGGDPQDPVQWHAFFNAPYSIYQSRLQDTPVGPLLGGVIPASKTGGFLSNSDNAYVTALVPRTPGEVVVLTGKAPTTTQTLNGERVMGSGQLRYWSMCENDQVSQRVVACVFDQQVPLDSSGRYRIVVSSPADRPANATAECGFVWLPWGAQPDAQLILRNMLPAKTFAHALQRIQKPGTEKQVVGEYLPRGIKVATASFEKQGCTTHR